MTVSNPKNWKTLLIMSVLLPLGLLSAFKLSGFMNGPVAIAETKTLEPVNWEFAKPDVGFFHFQENVSGHFYSDGVRIDEKIIASLFEDQNIVEGLPTLTMGFELMSSIPGGCVAEVNVTFHENGSGHSDVFPLYDSKEGHPNTYENLSMESLAGSFDLNGSLRAYFTLANPNRSADSHVMQVFEWVLNSPYNRTNFLFVDAEVTYYNGTVYKRVIQPFHLEVVPHFNDNFQTAEELDLNQTCRAFIAFEGYNAVKYYKTWLQSGMSVTWQLDSLGVAGTERRVYDPDMQLRDSLLYPTNASSTQLAVTVDKTGWWYVRLNIVASFGLYWLTVLNSTVGEQ